MTSTRPPPEEATRKPEPNHEQNHGKTAASSEEPADGGCTSHNALAFSTLLSSQETDTRRDPELPLRPSRRLFKFTRDYPLVKSAPARTNQTRKPDSAIQNSRTTSIAPLRSAAPCTQSSAEVLHWWALRSGTASQRSPPSRYINHTPCRRGK